MFNCKIISFIFFLVLTFPSASYSSSAEEATPAEIVAGKRFLCPGYWYVHKTIPDNVNLNQLRTILGEMLPSLLEPVRVDIEAVQVV